jgi:transcriptional regulator with XRE-family HTH domain
MMKKSLGKILKSRREALGLSQRELARKLGVKASHVGYLENGRRRPSLPLLGRLADTLGLDREPIFLLAHPEAKALLDSRDEPARVAARGRDQAWRTFTSDKRLQHKYGVTPKEMKLLASVNMHMPGKISSPLHFLFILNSIRQAAERE